MSPQSCRGTSFMVDGHLSLSLLSLRVNCKLIQAGFTCLARDCLSRLLKHDAVPPCCNTSAYMSFLLKLQQAFEVENIQTDFELYAIGLFYEQSRLTISSYPRLIKMTR